MTIDEATSARVEAFHTTLDGLWFVSAYPDSRRIVAQQAADLPAESVRRVFRDNAASVFKIDHGLLDAVP